MIMCGQKMKYFPPWPGKVTKHPEGIEKKGRAYVFFYGTHDFAFIEMANIMPYNSALPKHHRRKMYQMAVEEIRQIINDPTKEVCKSIRVCKNKTLGFTSSIPKVLKMKKDLLVGLFYS